MRAIVPSTTARAAVSSCLSPIAWAKSSAVPEGKIASAVSVPTRPLAARPTVPSPPMQPTTSAPASAAARTRASRSCPELETMISCSTPASCRTLATRPTTLPARPPPADGLTTTTIEPPVSLPPRGKALGRGLQRDARHRRDVRVAGPRALQQRLPGVVGLLGIGRQRRIVRVGDRPRGEACRHREGSQARGDLGLDRRDDVDLRAVEPVVRDRVRDLEGVEVVCGLVELARDRGHVLGRRTRVGALLQVVQRRPDVRRDLRRAPALELPDGGQCRFEVPLPPRRQRLLLL